MLVRIATLRYFMAGDQHRNYQELTFKNGYQVRTLSAKTAEEAGTLLNYIRANGYELSAIKRKGDYYRLGLRPCARCRHVSQAIRYRASP